MLWWQSLRMHCFCGLSGKPLKSRDWYEKKRMLTCFPTSQRSQRRSPVRPSNQVTFKTASRQSGNASCWMMFELLARIAKRSWSRLKKEKSHWLFEYWMAFHQLVLIRLSDHARRLRRLSGLCWCAPSCLLHTHTHPSRSLSPSSEHQREKISSASTIGPLSRWLLCILKSPCCIALVSAINGHWLSFLGGLHAGWTDVISKELETAFQRWCRTLGGVVDWIYRRQCGVLDFDGIWRKQQMLA